MSRWILPVFLALALALGGSAQGIPGQILLTVAGVALLAGAYFWPPLADYRDGKSLLFIGWAGAAIAALQMVPLPPAIWQALPGRGPIAGGDDLIGIHAVWRPLSLTPENTLATLLAWTVFLAILAFGLRRPTFSRAALVGVTVAGALLGALLGLAQRSGIAPHLYPFSSSGPTGQFANTNHLATLALAAIPMVAALAARAGDRGSPGSGSLLALTATAIFVVTIILTGAMAMIFLIIPVLLVSLLIVMDRADGRRWVVGGFVLMCVAVAASVWLGGLADQHVDISATSRLEIWRQSLRLSPFMIAGAGFGSFESLFHLVEDPLLVDRFYVNHAHNDLLELAIEGGVPALLLLGAMLFWWMKAAYRAWRGGLDPDPFGRAASVAVAVLLIHSLVDFPLRTLAHLSVLATCLLLLATSRPAQPVQDKGDLRPTRHRQVN